MGIGFDENDDYYSIADAAELTLQDGDWCICIWTYVSDNAGSNAQYVYNTNALAAANFVYLCLNEVGAANAGCWECAARDGDGTTVALVDTSAPGADSTWRLIVFQRNTGAAVGHEIELWSCEVGAAAVKENDDSDAGLGAVDGGDWNIGRRTDGNADRYYGGIAAEFSKGDFALTQAQIEALGAGLPVKTLAKQLGYTLDVYLPMWEADATLLDYSNNGNSGTRNSAPTTETHPPICTPVKRRRMG